MSREWQQQVRATFVLPPRLLTYIRQLEQSAGYDHKLWDTLDSNEMKEIRKLIYGQLWRIQRGRCAYCGMLKFSERLDREHFLPKQTYLKLMFHPYNIVLACKQCNRDHKKNRTPLSVRSQHGQWARQHGITIPSFTFKYWHPHFHDPKKHFSYSGFYNAKIEGISKVGLDTIRLFGWGEHVSMLARIQNQSIFDKLDAGLITDQDLSLIGRTISYKK